MKKMLLFLIALMFAITGMRAQNTLYVPGGYTTIQAAINASTNGDIIQVAAGTYTEQISVTKTLTLNGNNTGISAGAVPGTRIAETIITGGFYINTAASGTVIDGFTIEQGINNGSHKTGVVVGSASVKIKNNIIKDCGVLPAPFGQSDGIEVIGNSNNLFIKDNEIVNNWRGIYLNPSSGISLEGNAIHANNGVGVGIGSDGQSNFTLTGNKIYDHNSEGWGISAVGSNVVAHNNSFYNNLKSIVQYSGSAVNATLNYWGTASPAFDEILTGSVLYDPWWEDAAMTLVGSNNPVINLTRGTSFSTIQAAINAAIDGDIIQIAAGTYNEALTVGKSLTFIGSGPVLNPTTIISSSTNPIINLSVTDKSYSFQNLIIHGNVTNLGIRAGSSISITLLEMKDVIAENCKVAVYLSEGSTAIVNTLNFNNLTLQDNTHIGAYIGRIVVSGTVTNSTITHNGFTNDDAIDWQKIGLQFVDFYGTTVPHVVVANSTFNNNGAGASSIEKTGLSFYTAANVYNAPDLLSVSGCTFTNHPQYAVRIKNGYNVGNTATVNGTFSNNWLDIWFNNVIGSTSSTTLVRNTFTGIRTVGTGPTFDYNTIQAAINAANHGDEIKVAPGIYNETVNGDGKNSLKIIGTNPVNEPIINGNTHFSTCNDLYLENLILKNTAASPVAYIGGTNLTLNNVTVDGEDIIGHHGISGGHINGDVTITNSSFINIKNWVAFDTRSGSGGPIDGALLDEVIFTGNLVDNTIGHINFRGTLGSPTTSVIISGNTVQNTGNATNSFGGIIKVFYATTCSFTGNTIKDVGTSGYNPAGEAPYGAGFMPRNVANLTVTGNTFENNNQAIAFEPRNADISGFADGVLSAGVINSNNIFINNTYGVYIPATLHPSSNPSALTIDHNKFTGTMTKALNFGYAAGSLSAQNNYWGIETPAGVAAVINGNVDYVPWCNSDFSVCGFTTTSNVYNISQGTYFESVGEAILAAEVGNVIEITGTHNVKNIVVNKGLKMAAGAGGAHFSGLGGTRSGTGLIVTADARITGITFSDYEIGIDIQSGAASIANCKFFNNVLAVKNLSANPVADADSCYWNAPTGPEDTSPVGLYNPLGQGDLVTDYVDYQPWYNNADLTESAIDIAIYNPSCATLEVRIKSAAAVSEVLTNMQFAVAWNTADYTGDVVITGSPMYNIFLVNHVTDGATGTRYAFFAADYTGAAVSLAANTEQTIITLGLDESGAKFNVADFVIAQDAYAFNHNANYYIQLYASDRTGYIYGFGDDVYVASCDLELDAKVFLQGPYDAATNLMKTDIRAMASFPTQQPFNTAPFSYAGTENVTPIPADAVDWVLVGLRAATAGPDNFRVAGLLYKDGKIRGVDGQLISIENVNLFPNTPYYAVVYHRNHMPVMSATAINIPNTSAYNFTDNWNKGYMTDAEHPMVTLETGVYGMIAGDHYGASWSVDHWVTYDYPDGWLYYTGQQNERDPILAKITGHPGNGTFINGVINDLYYKEDVTMNKQVRYSGSGNDPRLIIQNLIELKGTTNLNTFYASKVPGWAESHAKKAGQYSKSGPLDIALYDTPRELLINITANEQFEDAIVSNIQFTLCWDESNMAVEQLVSSFQSDYLLEPQGEPVIVNGKMYLVFATVEPVSMPDPLNTGEKVTLIKFFKDDPELALSDAIFIAADNWTMDNNGGYYISVWGADKTGKIMTNALGTDDPGIMASTLQVYPNPAAQGWTYLTFKPVTTETLMLTLSDLSGRIICSENWSVNEGITVARALTLSGLSKGAYMISITGGSFRAHQRIIVQ